MNKEILLSIVVPTKNRIEYMKSFIQLYSSFDQDRTELVIQDNSDNESGMQEYINQFENMNIVYNYIKDPMPVIENSELAILNSHGKYVCFMGDDDLLSKYIINIVEKMENENIDSVILKKAIFNWPGMEYKVHHFPNLIIPKFSGKLVHVDPKREYQKLLKHGGVELGKLPQLYHGIVKRSVLDDVRNITGTFFPGPSPDMAVATALACFVNNQIYIDAPFISSGKSPKSAAGLGAKHQHKGELKSMTFLPDDIEKKWDSRLPFIWTGPTIYAESVIEAIRSMGRDADLDKFNFTFFYAYFDTFCREYKKQTVTSKKNVELNYIQYIMARILAFFIRLKIFVKNKICLFTHWGGKFVDDIPNCIEAENIIDEEIIRTIKFSL